MQMMPKADKKNLSVIMIHEHLDFIGYHEDPWDRQTNISFLAEKTNINVLRVAQYPYLGEEGRCEIIIIK